MLSDIEDDENDLRTIFNHVRSFRRSSRASKATVDALKITSTSGSSKALVVVEMTQPKSS